MVTTATLGALLATLARVDWVDFVLVGLMLLAAVHGLRLGALVQLLTFGGFWLGFLLGIFIFVPLFSFMTIDAVAGSCWPDDECKTRMLTASGSFCFICAAPRSSTLISRSLPLSWAS